MKYAIMDTETTGIYVKDEVIQFSAIITDEKFNVIGMSNFYCDTVYPISKKAAEVNGLNYELLHELSKGLTFEDQFLPFVESLGDEVCWVEWSTSGFDKRMITQTLAKCKLPAYNFGKSITSPYEATGVCNFNLLHAVSSMYNKGKPLKLMNAAKMVIGNDISLIDNLYNKNIKKFDIETGAHHADYDAFVTYLILIMSFNR